MRDWDGTKTAQWEEGTAGGNGYVLNPAMISNNQRREQHAMGRG